MYSQMDEGKYQVDAGMRKPVFSNFNLYNGMAPSSIQKNNIPAINKAIRWPGYCSSVSKYCKS